MQRRFKRLLGATLGTTYLLILLGLHTGNTAGGLSCGANWPFCNGWLGLFPANWASFFEWFHRFVAMVDGFLLLGVLYGAWRWQDDRRVAWAITGAIALLPAQILLGGVTTTAGGLFPGGFNPVVIVAHFTTATVIFGLLAYATARVFDAPGVDRFRQLLAAGVALVLGAAIFEYVAPFGYPPANDVGYYAVTFALLALLVVVLVWSVDSLSESQTRFRLVALGAMLVLYFDMVLSRELFGLPEVLGQVTSVAVFLLMAGLLVLVSGSRLDSLSGRSQQAD